MKNILVWFVIFTVAVAVSAGAETLSLEDPRNFYTDMEGHHGTGEGTAADRNEAVRIAKSHAIENIFNELGKDRMFIEMFISRWPEAIEIEDSVDRENDDGSFTALVRVVIGQQAVIMTEQSYTDSVLNLLDRAEGLLEEAESRVAKGQNHEENLQLAAAYTQYKQAESRLKELKLLLEPLGDSALQSSKGNSKPALMQIITTLQQTVSSAIARLEEIERETEVSKATEEIRRTYDLLQNELSKVEAVIEEYGAVSPFYDLPKDRLEAIRVDLEQAMELNSEIGDKFRQIKDGVPPDKLFLIEKIELSKNETENYEAVLGRLHGEVVREIRVPRLLRQERARRWAEFKKGLGHALVKRKPLDVFTLRYYLPLGLSTGGGGGFGFTGEFDFTASVEYYFGGLFWFHTALVKDDYPFPGGGKNIGLSQELNIGFGRRFLVGAGAEWDWGRWIKDTAGSDGTVKELYVQGFIGMIDRTNNWPWALLILRLPLRPAHPLFLGKIGGSLEMMLRIHTLFQIGGGVSGGFMQIDSVGGADTLRNSPDEYLQYQVRWFALFGVRLPKPFLWGLRVEGGSGSGITAGGDFTGPDTLPLLWRLFVQYSL
jgi:hypothetical protein